eukprot:tig00021517_g22009.t1
MDCLMPVMDGFEATGAIRGIESERGLGRHFVVALTAKATSEDEQECLRAGMDRYLAKPVRRATLAAMLEERAGMLQGGSVRGATATVASRRPFSEPVEPIAEADPPSGPPSGVTSRRASAPAPAAAVDARRPSGAERQTSIREWQAEAEAAAAVGDGAGGIEEETKGVGDINIPGFTGGEAGTEGPPPAPSPSEARLEATVPPDDPQPPSRPKSRLNGGVPATPSSNPSDSQSPPLPPPVSPVSPAAESTKRVPVGPPLDIMIVDDVEMNRRVLVALLSKEGHKIEVACDGKEAAEIFERRAKELEGATPPEGPPRPVFDCVFMDITMPVMDGYASTRRIRHTEKTLVVPVPTPVVACTALSSSDDRESMTEAGMDDLVVKPVGRAKIFNVLAKWAKRGGYTANAYEGSRRGGHTLASLHNLAEKEKDKGVSGDEA